MRMVRMYRHLKLMKRSGRGNLPGGLQSTQPGDLAPGCAACPHPGVNLPDDWQTVSAEWK